MSTSRENSILILALYLGISLAGAQSLDPGQLPLDREGLEQTEDLSESLANALIDFSSKVQDKDLIGVSQFFHDPVQATPWPFSFGTTTRDVKWISLFTPSISPNRKLTVGQLKQTWEQFLDRFSEIEDARFKVKQARFSGAPGTKGFSGFKFFLVGRDQAKRRLWVRGNGKIEAARSGPESWRISLFEVLEIQVLRAERDLFSQIAVPAGL